MRCIRASRFPIEPVQLPPPKGITPPMTLAKFVFTLVAALLLSGCVEEELPPAGQSLVSAREAACVAEGGRWGQGGAAGLFVCYRDTRDGGEACAASTDCQGLCLARSRTCAPVTPLFGCNDVLSANGVRNILCVD